MIKKDTDLLRNEELEHGFTPPRNGRKHSEKRQEREIRGIRMRKIAVINATTGPPMFYVGTLISVRARTSTFGSSSSF